MSQETDELFRGWITELKSWADWIEIYHDGSFNLGKEIPLGLENSYDGVLIQNIGIKDNAGKDAFGDDIIEFDNTDIGGMKGRARIIYEYDRTLVPAPGWYLETKDKRILKQWPFGFKIIGNYLENPELLDSE